MVETTYVLRHVLAQYALGVAARFQTTLLSPAIVGTIYSLHGAACCWKDLLSPEIVGIVLFSTWSSLFLERPAFSGKFWHCILFVKQFVGRTPYFPRQVLALYALY